MTPQISDEGLLRARRIRRIRRKLPSSLETDSFNLPYSFNQRSNNDSVDLNDDSESDGFTMPDSLFRAPPAVRYSAYIIAFCMFGMVALAMQYRFVRRPWVRPDIWIPRLALGVMATLVFGLVYGYFTQSRFSRKHRSTGQHHPDTTHNMKSRSEQRKTWMLVEFRENYPLNFRLSSLLFNLSFFVRDISPRMPFLSWSPLLCKRRRNTVMQLIFCTLQFPIKGLVYKYRVSCVYAFTQTWQNDMLQNHSLCLWIRILCSWFRLCGSI